MVDGGNERINGMAENKTLTELGETPLAQANVDSIDLLLQADPLKLRKRSEDMEALVQHFELKQKEFQEKEEAAAKKGKHGRRPKRDIPEEGLQLGDIKMSRNVE